MKQISDALILAYLDGELDSGDRMEVAAAIEADPSLRAHVDFLRETERAAGDALKRTAPPTLASSVMHEVRTHAPAHPQQEKHANGALYTFLALLGTFVGIALLVPSERAQQGPYSPAANWFSTVLDRIGEMTAGSGDMFKGLSIDASNTMMLAVVAFLLLALLDMYVLRPLLKKNGHQ